MFCVLRSDDIRLGWLLSLRRLGLELAMSPRAASSSGVTSLQPQFFNRSSTQLATGSLVVFEPCTRYAGRLITTQHESLSLVSLDVHLFVHLSLVAFLILEGCGTSEGVLYVGVWAGPSILLIVHMFAYIFGCYIDIRFGLLY